MYKSVLAGLALLATLAGADQVLALGGDGKSSASYSVSVKGVRAGRMDISSTVNGSSYSTSVNMRSTGVVAALATFKFVANSGGTVKGVNGFSPKAYSEKSDTGRRKSNVKMSYAGGVPKPNKTFPAPALPGGGQKGTVDPMTAMFAVFRDQSKANLCKTKLTIYDGKRRMRLRLSPGKIGSKSASCNGTFERLGGFSKKRMAEGRKFPLTVTYDVAGGVYRVKSLVINSSRGRAAFSRR